MRVSGSTCSLPTVTAGCRASPFCCAVMRDRRITGAGLDVFHVEPLPADSPLMTLDNVLITQHSICGSRQAGRATNVAVMEGIVRVSRGELPDNILNPDVLKRPGFRAKLARYRADQPKTP